MARSLGGLDLNRVHVGEARELMRHLPDGCVHTICTSPPYFGLRSYNIPSAIWGGDTACEHDWGEPSSGYVGHRADKGPQVPQTKWPANASHPTPNTPTVSSICIHCEAWLGCLGLEPTPQAYVDHLREVMREARRVLRDDGTLWINLGDSFSTHSFGAGASHDPKAPGRRQRQEGSQPNRSPIPGIKHKDLIGIPWMVAFALRDDGWWLRSDIVWHKPSPMPEAILDRPTRAHEFVFLLAKDSKYFYDIDAIREPFADDRMSKDGGQIGRIPIDHRLTVNNPKPSGIDPSANGGRNKRDVWMVPPERFSDERDQHFAVMPSGLVRPCLLAGTSERGACPACGSPWVRPAGDNWRPSCTCGRRDTVPCVVLDPFVGAGTVGKVAQELGRDWIGFDLNPSYADIAARRTAQGGLMSWRPDPGPTEPEEAEVTPPPPPPPTPPPPPPIKTAEASARRRISVELVDAAGHSIPLEDSGE